MARTASDVDTPTAGEVIESLDPATGEVVGAVPVTAPGDVEDLAAEAARIQRGWGLVPIQERLRVIARAVDDILDRKDEIATLVTREAGKTIVESMLTEIVGGAIELSWVARYGHRYLVPERVPDPQILAKHKRHWILYHPIGVVGIISPWNYPFMLAASQVGFALASGNAVVLKPSELTPLTAEEIAKSFARAGLPDGLLRVVHGVGDTGAAVVAAPSVARVFFTGSVATGRRVLEEAARHGKTAVLELGGNDPAVVCADADLDRAVAGTLWAGVTNCGQTCTAVERIYVDRRVYEEFVRRLVDAAERIAPGDPKDAGTQVGPLMNEAQYDKVKAHFDEALAKGATAECGGPAEVPGLTGRFFAPAVLTGVDHTMETMREETFGPLLPVMPFETEQEAVRLANDTRYGLGASVWSRDVTRARLIAERIEAGMVWINDHAYSHGFAQLPWGGIKDSGVGVTHSKFGFYDMVEPRLVGEDSGHLPGGWWYPYDEVKRRGFAAIGESMAASTLGRRARALWANRRTLGEFVRALLK